MSCIEPTCYDSNPCYNNTGCLNATTFECIKEPGTYPSLGITDLMNGKQVLTQLSKFAAAPTVPLRTPASQLDPFGIVGQITYDNNNIYVKTGVGWKKLALALLN